ncbi:hypothetical protein [Agaribacterium sp. ZY112]|uniref:hypothetical protein n=1 Tax=Agaribacterium sp. ZY112 TaxID=3233574 RepID=UPI003523C487
MNILFIIFAIFFATLCGVMAKRKNRNIALWVVLGAIGGLVSFIVLALIPYICPHCSKNFSKDSDGTRCGSCGKRDALDSNELIKLESFKETLMEKGISVKHDGVKITITQKSGAKLKFVGIDSLEKYVLS